MKRETRCGLVLTALVLLLFLLLAVSIALGSVRVPLWETLRILMHREEALGEMAGRILWQIRMPRALAAALLGGALAVSGFLLQTFFANPIAGPFVLGISSGAKLFVAAALILALRGGLVLNSFGLVGAAFAGAMLSMGFVLAVSGRVRSLSVLVVCGVMIGYICSAVTDILVTFADDANIVNLHSWSLGSFSGLGWESLRMIAPAAAVCLFFALLLSKPIGAYQLGEVYAASVGVNIRRLRLCLILLSSFLSALVTAYAGPVSFVGIAVPHLMKSLLKTAKPLVLLPASFLGGASFVLFCDLAARSAFAPTELGINSVTAVFGAPVVIAMLVRGQGNGRR